MKLFEGLIEKEFIEKWNGELPKITNGNTFFDVSSILGGK